MTRSFPCTHVYCTQLWDWKVGPSIGGEFCLSTNVKNCSINMSIRKRVLVLRKAKLVKKAHHLRNLSLQHHQTVYLSVCCISNIKNAFKISVDSNFSVYYLGDIYLFTFFVILQRLMQIFQPMTSPWAVKYVCERLRYITLDLSVTPYPEVFQKLDNCSIQLGTSRIPVDSKWSSRPKGQNYLNYLGKKINRKKITIRLPCLLHPVRPVLLVQVAIYIRWKNSWKYQIGSKFPEFF